MSSPATFEEVVEDFALLDDWEDRYRYLIDLGHDLEPMNDALKSENTRVQGCVSQVWMVAAFKSVDGSNRFEFTCDSDALIVRGLLALLHKLLCGLTPTQIIEYDILAQLQKLDLASHLSSQRSNGLQAMVAHIKRLAEQNR